MPVVESGSFELAVVNGESHWLDYVQARAGRGAGARGVLRYFRFNENYVQLHFCPPVSCVLTKQILS